MDHLFFIHLLIVLFVVFMPFMPLKVLRYGIYIPTIIVAGWAVFGGCVITQKQKDIAEDSFVLTLLRRFKPDMTLAQSNSWLQLVMVGGTLIAAKRLGAK